MRPYARHVLRRKKKAENTHTHIYTDMCIHIQKKKEELPVNLKPQNSKIHTHTPQKKQKKTVSETPNHSNSNTHTNNYKHIKYQRQVKQTKVNTLQANDPYINPLDQPKIIQTRNKSEFKSHKIPH